MVHYPKTEEAPTRPRQSSRGRGPRKNERLTIFRDPNQVDSVVSGILYKFYEETSRPPTHVPWSQSFLTKLFLDRQEKMVLSNPFNSVSSHPPTPPMVSITEFFTS